MKKLFTLLTALLLLVLPVSSAFAATLDLSYVRRNTENLFTLDIDTANNAAFVETQLSAAARSYVHKYESVYRYNTTKFDVLVLNYSNASTTYPVWRLWVTYCADNDYLYFDKITFNVNGTKYTFSGVSNSDRYTHDDKGYVEEALIKFDDTNLAFLAALEEWGPAIGEFEDVSYLDNFPVYMTLHGREDITVTLGSGFWLDYLAIREAFIEMNGLDYITRPNGTTMTVK